MLDKRAVLLSKDEGTYNTDSVPVVGTNAILVEDLKWAFVNTRMVQRNPVRASLAKLPPIYAGTLLSITGKVEIKGSGVAGTAPELAPLLRAGGFAETLVGGTSATYKPTSTQATHKSQSMYFYDDGLLLKMTGAMVKPSFDLQVGKDGMMAFDAIGHFVSVTDSALPSATYVAAAPPMLINVPFSVGSYAAIITKLAFDMGIDIALPESISATDGYGQIQIAGRLLTGSFNPQRVTVGTKDFISIWKAGTPLALDTGVIGGTAGNRYQITMPVITYVSQGRSNEKNVGTFDSKFQAAENTGDDEVSIVFT